MKFGLCTTYYVLVAFGLQSVQARIGKPVSPDKLKYNQKEALELTNSLRARHEAPPLQYDEELIRKATDCARYYVQLKKIDHSCPYAGKHGHGENLALLQEFPDISDAIQYSVQSWYNEIKNYSFDDPKKSEGRLVGHFTQLVWNSSRWVGMDAIETEGHETYVVAIYDPRGNLEYVGSCLPGCRFGLYKQNVMPPIDWNVTTTPNYVPPIHRNTKNTYKSEQPNHRNATRIHNVMPPIHWNSTNTSIALPVNGGPAS